MPADALADKPADAPHVAIIGGGITGLAAALRLREVGPQGMRITVIDQANQLGGKLRTSTFAGQIFEHGAEAFLLRRPEAIRLVERLGLADQLVHPVHGQVLIYVDGRLVPLPAKTILGIPGDLTSLAASGVLTPTELAQVMQEQAVGGEPLTGDVSVGELVRTRLGTAVVSRLVDPLLGGVYAGRADDLSILATMPGLATELAQQPSLLRAAQHLVFRESGNTPVFGGIRGGMTRLVTAAAQASTAQFLLGYPVQDLTRRGAGWQLTVGSNPDAQVIEADAVIVATPAQPASRLLSREFPVAAGELATTDYASIALVGLAFPTDGDTTQPAVSGVLIPATEGFATKAITFVSSKWPGYPADCLLLRASIGRYGEEEVLHRDDQALTQRVLAEVRTILASLGLPDLGNTMATTVVRWGGALPQYVVGHVDRVSGIRKELAGWPRLALAGAAYDGVGIPACIASGERAAEQVLTALSADRGQGAESAYG